MVKAAKKNGMKCFTCEACDFAYKDKKMAQTCEDYCNLHHACSIEITKNAIQ